MSIEAITNSIKINLAGITRKDASQAREQIQRITVDNIQLPKLLSALNNEIGDLEFNLLPKEPFFNHISPSYQWDIQALVTDGSIRNYKDNVIFFEDGKFGSYVFEARKNKKTKLVDCILRTYVGSEVLKDICSTFQIGFIKF